MISAINVPNGSVFSRGSNTIQELRGHRKEQRRIRHRGGHPVVDARRRVLPAVTVRMNLNVSDSVPNGPKAGELSPS